MLPAKVSRIETAARRPAPRDVRDLCALYGVDEAGTAELMQLARQAREQGWWTQYGGLSLYPFIGLGGCFFNHLLLHVLCPWPTADRCYARAIIKAIVPRIIRISWSSESRLGFTIRSCSNARIRLGSAYSLTRLCSIVGRQCALVAAQLARIVELVEDGKATAHVCPLTLEHTPRATARSSSWSSTIPCYPRWSTWRTYK